MRITHVLRGLSSNKPLNLMIVLLIAVAIGCFGTTYSIFHVMSHNPLHDENELTRYLRIDDWDPAKDQSFVPPLLIYRDAISLSNQLPANSKKVLTYDSGGIVVLDSTGEGRKSKPYFASIRVTTVDFFDVFKTRFKFGERWSTVQENQKQRVIVLSEKMNQRLFNGENSVGKTVQLLGEIFKVQGVLADFEMTPKLYDLHVYPLGKIEDILMPFDTGIAVEASPHGRFFGWRDEVIETFPDMLNSTNIWLQLWLQFDSSKTLFNYQTRVTQYIEEQKKQGRMLKNTAYENLLSPSDWLKLNRVVKPENRFLVLLAFAFFIICMLSSMGLLHASFDARKTSVALQRALGASRMQLVKNMLGEVTILAVFGCLLGSILVYFGLHGMRLLYGSEMQQLAQMSISSIAVTISIAILSALVIALFPAWKTCRLAPAPLLK